MTHNPVPSLTIEGVPFNVGGDDEFVRAMLEPPPKTEREFWQRMCRHAKTSMPHLPR